MIYGVPRAFLALDSLTGQLCRTWDFRLPNPSEAQKPLQNLPECVQIYVNSNH